MLSSRPERIRVIRERLAAVLSVRGVAGAAAVGALPPPFSATT
jgi:hypothetical protein